MERKEKSKSSRRVRNLFPFRDRKLAVLVFVAHIANARLALFLVDAAATAAVAAKR